MPVTRREASNAMLRKFPSVADIEKVAAQRLPRFLADFLFGACDNETSLAENRHSLDKIRLVPRFGVSLHDIDLSTNALGHWSTPFGISPVGYGGAFWPGAELSLAGAAERNRMPYILSTMSISPLEAIAAVAPTSTWFQLYLFRDWQINLDILRRLKEVGIETLVVTIDTPAYSKRLRDLRHGIQFPFAWSAHIGAQLLSRPSWTFATFCAGAPTAANLLPYLPSGLSRDAGLLYLLDNLEGETTWHDIGRLRSEWAGNLIVKGIMDPADAMSALDSGADAVIVSNHGGRQFDASPAAVDILPRVVSAVNERAPVFMDSGIRSGLDIVRAMARGADGVFAGRPFYAAIAAMGIQGAEFVIDLLINELKVNLAHLGIEALTNRKTLGTTEFVRS